VPPCSKVQVASKRIVNIVLMLSRVARQVRKFMARKIVAATAGALWKIMTSPGRFGLRITKFVIYLAVLVVFGASVYSIGNLGRFRLLMEFEALNRVDPLPEAKRILEEKGYCEALDYLDAFRDYDYVRDNSEVSAFYNDIKTSRDSLWFRGQDVLEGIWRGKGACPESLISATAADFFVVGDVRDLLWQGVKKYRGEETDEFTAALAGLGVVLAGVTWGSAGAAAPVKGTVSLLKTGKRLDKISAPMQKSLIGALRKSSATRSLEPVRPLVASLHDLATTPGMKSRDVFAVLSRSRQVEDLQHAADFAKAFGPKSGKLLHLGGDAPISLFRKFGKSEPLARAMDEALQFGPKGMSMLEKLGPTRFMTYLKLTKYGVRGARSIHQDRLNLVLARAITSLPVWSLWTIAVLTGVTVIGAPVIYIVKMLRQWRSPGFAPA
jgi:hypothetical protein